jgi:multicomponent Na+:H+ antiporter subunit B
LKYLALFVVVLCGSLLIYIAGDFPSWGDPGSPASTYLSPHFIEKTMEETSVPNIVTAVLADYRSYDTMFETIVVFTAGLACFFLLGTYKRKDPEQTLFRHIRTGVVLRFKGQGCHLPEGSESFERIDPHWTPYDFIVSRVSKLIIPFIQLFGLYVIAHGHHSPGGGFQGGVILGAAFLLLALSHNLRTMSLRFKRKDLGIATAMGVIIYAGVGALGFGMGFHFLDYAPLGIILGVDPLMARSLGILFVEIGVGITVMATMVIIYNNVASEGKYEEGL